MAYLAAPQLGSNIGPGIHPVEGLVDLIEADELCLPGVLVLTNAAITIPSALGAGDPGGGGEGGQHGYPIMG